MRFLCKSELIFFDVIKFLINIIFQWISEIWKGVEISVRLYLPHMFWFSMSSLLLRKKYILLAKIVFIMEKGVFWLFFFRSFDVPVLLRVSSELILEQWLLRAMIGHPWFVLWYRNVSFWEITVMCKAKYLNK